MLSADHRSPSRARDPKRRRAGIAWLAVVAALVVSFWTTRIVLSGTQFTGNVFDLYHFNYLHYAATYAWLAAGVIPLWTPYDLTGLPWLADPQGGVFYPPHVLYLVLPTHLALAASGLLHLVWIALSTAWFARRAGLHAAAAALAAALFTLRGTMPAELLAAPSRLEAGAWLPLGCLAVLDLARAAKSGTRRDALRAGAVLALAAAMSCLAGYPQSTVFLGYAWTTLFVALLLGLRMPLARWPSTGSVFGIALALGALVALVQLLPSLELSRAGARTTETLGVDQMFPFGDPGPAILRDALSGSWRSFGVVALSLLPAALLAPRFRVVAVWALAFGALAFVFALGSVTPLFDLYLHLPVLGWFRAPYRMLMLADFCFAICVAIGLAGIKTAVEAARQPKTAGAPGGPARLAKLAALGVPAIVALVLSIERRTHGAYVGAGFAAWAALVLLIGAVRSSEGRWLQVALVSLVVLEMFFAPPNRSRLPYTAAAVAEYRVYEDVFRTLAAAAGHDRVWLLRFGLMPRAAPKLSNVYGFRSFNSKSTATLARQASYYTFLAEGSTRSKRRGWVFQGDVTVVSPQRQERSPALARLRLVDLAAVRFVVTERGGLWWRLVQDFVDAAGFRPTAIVSDDFAVFENPRALPRAYVVYRVRAAPPAEQLLGRLSRADFDPLVESYVEGPAGFEPAANAPARGAPATIVRDDLRIVEVDAALEAPGLLVLADSYYDGWQATVDGSPVGIVATNHLFRGVPVPAGRHRVRFEYRPWSVVGGAMGSLAGTLALVAAFVWTRSRRAPDA